MISQKREIAQDIVLFELSASAQAILPEGSPGAHISVTGPTGLVRKYSLCNAPDERAVYRIAVKRESEGSGGSRALIDLSAVGDRLEISHPQNDFPLEVSAPQFVFIAGGIGITPIYSMMKHLNAVGLPYTLYYFTRTEADAAFRDDLIVPGVGRQVVLHHDGGDPAMGLDLGALLLDRPEGAHLYCCGPRGLMEAVRAAAAHWPSGSVHFEDFGSEQAGSEANGSFDVRLARSGKLITVPPELSIIEAVRQAGVDVPTSCETGTCGTCKTALLAGEADHRDLALFDDEFDSFIIPCVSRAKTPEITIDL